MLTTSCYRFTADGMGVAESGPNYSVTTEGIKLVALTWCECTTQCMLLSEQMYTLHLGSRLQAPLTPGASLRLKTSLRSYGTISIDLAIITRSACDMTLYKHVPSARAPPIALLLRCSAITDGLQSELIPLTS